MTEDVICAGWLGPKQWSYDDQQGKTEETDRNMLVPLPTMNLTYHPRQPELWSEPVEHHLSYGTDGHISAVNNISRYITFLTGMYSEMEVNNYCKYDQLRGLVVSVSDY
jgi:hypothetical protein